MKKILVTGATGFIGNYVVTELLKQGCFVIATSTNEEKARTSNWFNKVEYIPFDFDAFDDAVNYYEYFHNPEAIIHLAWQGLPNYKSPHHIEKNFPLHFGFIQNLITNGLKDITVIGTCFEYGMQEGSLSENMDSLPTNPYAIGKDMLRKQLEQFQIDRYFDLKWVRLFYMYGKGQSSSSLLSKLATALENGDAEFNMSGGEQERDYLPVERVAEIIVKITLQHKVLGIINCASGQPIKIKKLVENYLKKEGKAIKLNFGYYPYSDYEPMSFWGDTKKLYSIDGLK